MDIRYTKLVYYVGKVSLLIIKYFCLFLFIFTAGKTIGLTVYSLIKGDAMPNTLIATMVGSITGNDIHEILEAIVKYGKLDTIVSASGIGFADSITFLLLFFVIGGYSRIFKALILENIYTKENLEILKESVPLTLILLFTQPIVITLIRDIIKINDSFGSYNFIGIPFAIISIVLYIVVDNGLDLEKKIKSYERKLAKVEEEKQEAEIIALEKKVREHHDSKAKKKTTAKKNTTTKVEEPKKATSTTKKVAKTTTKKSSK